MGEAVSTILGAVLVLLLLGLFIWYKFVKWRGFVRWLNNKTEPPFDPTKALQDIVGRRDGGEDG